VRIALLTRPTGHESRADPGRAAAEAAD
jgi:hypothetical protein